jgi:hypothetical protein
LRDVEAAPADVEENGGDAGHAGLIACDFAGTTRGAS